MPLSLPSFEKSDIPTGGQKAAERTKSWGVFPQRFSNIMEYTHFKLNEEGNKYPAKGADLLRICYKAGWGWGQATGYLILKITNAKLYKDKGNSHRNTVPRKLSATAATSLVYVMSWERCPLLWNAATIALGQCCPTANNLPSCLFTAALHVQKFTLF